VPYVSRHQAFIDVCVDVFRTHTESSLVCSTRLQLSGALLDQGARLGCRPRLLDQAARPGWQADLSAVATEQGTVTLRGHCRQVASSCLCGCGIPADNMSGWQGDLSAAARTSRQMSGEGWKSAIGVWKSGPGLDRCEDAL